MPLRVILGQPGFISRLPKLLIALFVAIVATQLPALADTTAWQTNPWLTESPIPTAVEGHCSALIGHQIYTAFGNDGTFDTSLLQIYDIASNTWSSGPTAPANRAEGYRGIAHGGKLWCVGGRVGGGPDESGVVPDTNIYSFDPAMQQWQTIPAAPPANGFDPLVGTTAVTFANNIFVFGGRKDPRGPCSGPASSEIQRYDIVSNTWSSGGSLTNARSDATAARVGRFIYIFGGCNHGGSTPADLEIYDPRNMTSTIFPTSMPGGSRANLSAADPQNGSSANASHLIQITGGFNATTCSPDTQAGCTNPGPCVFGGLTPCNHIAWDVDQQIFKSATIPFPTHCTDPQGRGEFELLYGGDRVFAVAGGCPAFGHPIDNVDMLKLSGTSTAMNPGTAYAASDVPNASMVAYSCGPKTFPICATEPLGVSVVLITGTGFAPLSTVSLTSSALGGLPAAVADVQGEFLTTFVDVICNGTPQSVTGTDSLGNTASVSFSCPEV